MGRRGGGRRVGRREGSTMTGTSAAAGAGGATADRLPWRVRVLTLFPMMFPGPLGHSLAGKALKAGVWALETVDIRDFARDKHATVDDTPYGGGAGMVLRPDVVHRAIAASRETGFGSAPGGVPLIYLTPRGRLLDQARVSDLASGPGAVVLCGRFEGVDQRAIDRSGAEEISLGDFVLSGGEPAAIALIDACVRLLPGVMGASQSLAEESFAGGLLEYPHYTRPAVWEDMAVPDVLVSGHHEKVRAWRLAEAERITRERRPDLWSRYAASGKGPAPPKGT